VQPTTVRAVTSDAARRRASTGGPSSGGRSSTSMRSRAPGS